MAGTSTLAPTPIPPPGTVVGTSRFPDLRTVLEPFKLTRVQMDAYHMAVRLLALLDDEETVLRPWLSTLHRSTPSTPRGPIRTV